MRRLPKSYMMLNKRNRSKINCTVIGLTVLLLQTCPPKTECVSFMTQRPLVQFKYLGTALLLPISCIVAQSWGGGCELTYLNIISSQSDWLTWSRFRSISFTDMIRVRVVQRFAVELPNVTSVSFEPRSHAGDPGLQLFWCCGTLIL